MRTLSTRVLFGSGEVKNKMYPANYGVAGDDHAHNDDETVPHSTYHAAVDDDDDDGLTAEAAESLAQAGDEDAMYVQLGAFGRPSLVGKALAEDYERVDQRMEPRMNSFKNQQDPLQNLWSCGALEGRMPAAQRPAQRSCKRCSC